MVEAEQTKGFQKVGGGSPTQSENFTPSPDFRLFLKISEDLAAPSLHVPMATPAGAAPPLPAAWTALRSPLTVAHTQPARLPPPSFLGAQPSGLFPRGWPSVRYCAGTALRALCPLFKTPTIRPLAWLRG